MVLFFLPALCHPYVLNEMEKHELKEIMDGNKLCTTAGVVQLTDTDLMLHDSGTSGQSVISCAGERLASIRNKRSSSKYTVMSCVECRNVF